MLQRARASGKAIFPPRIAEPGTGDPALDWVAAAGTGTIHSVTIQFPRPPAPPHAVVLVDLDEGVRMLSHMPGVDAEHIRIGDRVRARIVTGGDIPMVVFDPLETGRG
jgi:uncharacterized OB-fold protein